jgi:hypothetical protein
MSEEPTRIMLPRLVQDPIVRALVRAGLVLVLVVGAFVGAALFALGILVGVLL